MSSCKICVIWISAKSKIVMFIVCSMYIQYKIRLFSISFFKIKLEMFQLLTNMYL